MRLFSRVLAPAFVGAFSMMTSQAKAVTNAGLGVPVPGSETSSTEATNGCGERYKFASRARLSSVAQFYLDQGRSAGLTLLRDTDVGDPSYRMISFMRPHGHEVLFVTPAKTGKVTSGSVYYAPANHQQCR